MGNDESTAAVKLSIEFLFFRNIRLLNYPSIVAYLESSTWDNSRYNKFDRAACKAIEHSGSVTRQFDGHFNVASICRMC